MTQDEKNSDRKKHIMMNMRQYLGSETNASEVVENIQKRAQTASEMPGARRLRRRQINEKNMGHQFGEGIEKLDG